MVELLTQFSFETIIIVVILVALAIKEAFELYDYFHNKIKKKFDGDAEEDRRLDDVLDTVNNLSDRMDDVISKQTDLEDKVDIISTNQDGIKNDVSTLINKQSYMESQIAEQSKTLTILINSDKDQLKSHIVKEYHYFCDTKGWIDDFSMDSLNKCYEHYTREGGNTYVHDLMDELRKLPHHPPIKK